jgi:uncharacterized membrane protein required for colicin V production
MTVIDITLLVFLGAFVLAGFWFGLIHMIGALVGLFLGTFLASRFFEPLAQWLFTINPVNINLLRIVSFILISFVVTRLVGFAVHIADKAFKVISVIPFMKTFNRLLGAALGLVEGALLLGLFVYFASRFPISAPFEILLRDSQVARVFNMAGMLMSPFLPQAVRVVQSVL